MFVDDDKAIIKSETRVMLLTHFYFYAPLSGFLAKDLIVIARSKPKMLKAD